MSTGLAVFDTSISESNHWLKVLEQELPPCNRHDAYRAMRAVMHTLRDRLAPDGAMRLAAQLPLLLRGVYVEGWRPAETPIRSHTVAAFVDAVAAGLPPDFPVDAEFVTRCVVKVLWLQMKGGAMEKVKQEIPPALHTLWP
jgi:uncharacterized protein (DUF2267 family)